jgi:hypothetical protein
MRSRFFSVSPIYLLTIVERLILQRSGLNSRAITWAVIVLPVPEGPAKRAFVPLLSAMLSKVFEELARREQPGDNQSARPSPETRAFLVRKELFRAN